jgi:hypothetical protein
MRGAASAKAGSYTEHTLSQDIRERDDEAACLHGDHFFDFIPFSSMVDATSNDRTRCSANCCRQQRVIICERALDSHHALLDVRGFRLLRLQ